MFLRVGRRSVASCGSAIGRQELIVRPIELLNRRFISFQFRLELFTAATLALLGDSRRPTCKNVHRATICPTRRFRRMRKSDRPFFLIRMEQKEKSPKLGSSAAMETLGDLRLPRRSRQFSRLTRLRLLVWGFSSRRHHRRAAPSCFRRHQRPSGGGSSPWLPSPPRPTVRTGQSCWALPCRR